MRNEAIPLEILEEYQEIFGWLYPQTYAAYIPFHLGKEGWDKDAEKISEKSSKIYSGNAS